MSTQSHVFEGMVWVCPSAVIDDYILRLYFQN
jgi:hypothetical protein